MPSSYGDATTITLEADSVGRYGLADHTLLRQRGNLDGPVLRLTVLAC